MDGRQGIFELAAGVAQNQSAHQDGLDSRYFTNVATLTKMPDKILLHVFQYIPHRQLGRVASVCRKWRILAHDSRLWRVVSLRPEYSGLHVNNIEVLLAMISVRFGSTLRYIELPCELITAPVLHEIANKCPNLKYMTLDFSNAMQLHDFNDLNAFPCNLTSLCIALSEVIFMEGFMRRIYSCLSSLEILHLIGTFELSNQEEEEIYEVINISKIKAHTPNLRVVNLYGISFVDDTHIETLSSNCIHLQCLSLNFCLRVKGSSFKTLLHRCKKLTTLLLQHCNLKDEYIREVDWENTIIHELDLTSTELSSDCMQDMFSRMGGFTYLAVGHCEFFDDKVMDVLIDRGKLEAIKSIDLSRTDSLTENGLYKMLKRYGKQLIGLMICGKPKLAEQFFLNVIPLLKNIRICAIGTADGWFLKITQRIHVDMIMELFAQNCSVLERLEARWDPSTIRFSDKSSKFVDHIRIRCPNLKSITLADGEYYEIVKSNFERADRLKVVRTTTNYTTSIVSQISCYRDLLFN